MAIQRRNFPGVPKATLVQWLAWANEEIATGTTRQSWSAGDTNSAHWIDTNLPATTRRDWILNDLAIVDPDNYAAADSQQIKSARVRYLNG